MGIINWQRGVRDWKKEMNEKSIGSQAFEKKNKKKKKKANPKLYSVRGPQCYKILKSIKTYRIYNTKY
jgi:hypothetical protein